jgi:hypothetical protein
MNLNYKKSMRLALLIVSTLLIATASAAVYNQLFQTGHVTATTYGLQWIEGAENGTVGLSVTGATCSMSTLTAPVGGARNYTDPVRLNNTEATAHTYDLVISSLSGNTTHLEYLYVKLYNSTDDLKQTLTVWSGGSQGSNLNNIQIPGNDNWRFEWDIKWNTSSNTSSAVDVSLRIDVTA